MKKHQRNKEIEEDHKKQLLHVETLTLMTRYQFIFLKLQTAISNWSKTMEAKDSQDQLRHGFFKLQEHIILENKATDFRKRLIAQRIATKLESIVEIHKRKY